MTKLTVKDLFEIKGVRKLTQVFVRTPKEAETCEAAGIDMIVASEREAMTAEVRMAAPNTFLTIGQVYGRHASVEACLRSAYDAVVQGADAIYCPQSISYVEALATQGIPTVGHVGFVPYKKTWFGGFKAVGKTANEALELYNLAQSYEAAGAIGVELEIVPQEIAQIISQGVKIVTLGMGAGAGCDGQYLFATDILGDNAGHVPRHAKTYRNHRAEYDRLHRDSIKAFEEFAADVASGQYPDRGHVIAADSTEISRFVDLVERQKK